MTHPRRKVGTRLKAPKTDAQTLELWIKGPVFYGANVMLSSTQGNDGLKFAVSLERDPRAALIGYWRSGVADGRPS